MKFRDSYTTIQGWMIEDLQLGGNELIVYAVIYGFCRDGSSWYKLSQEYVAKWCNITTRGLRKILKSLEEKGLLKIKYHGKGEVSEYKTLKPDDEEVEEQSSASTGTKFRQYRNSVPPVEEQSSAYTSNNNIYNNNYNNTKEINKESQLESDFEELWKLYPRKRGKDKAFKAYKKAVKEGATNEEIRQGILNLIEDIRKNKTEERFIPYGSTFFNGKSWTDDMKTDTVQRTYGSNKEEGFDFFDF